MKAKTGFFGFKIGPVFRLIRFRRRIVKKSYFDGWGLARMRQWRLETLLTENPVACPSDV